MSNKNHQMDGGNRIFVHSTEREVHLLMFLLYLSRLSRKMIAILFVGVKCRVGNFPLPCDALQTVRMHQAIASASAVSKFDSTFGLLEGETFVLRPSQEQAPKL